MKRVFLSKDFNEFEGLSSLINLQEYDVVTDLSQNVLSLDDHYVKFDNLVEFVGGLENFGVKSREIVVAGGLLSFSSEVNVRSLISGFLGLVKNRFRYVDDSLKISSRIEVLGRAFRSLGIYPTVRTFGDLTMLSFDRGEIEELPWSAYSSSEFFNKSIEPNFLNDSDFFEALEYAVDNEVPFSFVRINHCENRLIGQGYSFSSEEAKIAYDIQFGRMLNVFETLDISSGIKRTIIGCDIVGVPSVKKFSSHKLHLLEAATYQHFYNLGLYAGQKLCRVNMHYAIGVDDRYRLLFLKCKKLVAITCRDIENLERSIGRSITKLAIPEENRFSQSPSAIPHYPDVFLDIKEKLISEVGPGVVVLIGAGLLGKIYCGWIKELGGIALDVGSLMDAVGDKVTRGKGFNRKFWWQV